MVSVPHFSWRSFQSIPSAAEAALASDSCLFSLSTLEVYSHPQTLEYAVVEVQQAGVWRWAIVDEECAVVESGREKTRAKARRAAENALAARALITAG